MAGRTLCDLSTLYRVYKCRYMSCESTWMEENKVKEPRCLVCGGATPYRSMPMPQTLAMAKLNSQDPTGSVADTALNLLSKRITTSHEVGEEHVILLRSLYECFQGGLSCFLK